MRCDSRLNLLLTPPPAYERGDSHCASQPWHRTLSQLLVPLGVRTFEARCGSEAVDIIEKHPIHLAVVDSRLPAIGGMNVLQLVQRLGAQRHLPPAQHATPQPEPHGETPHVEVRMEQRAGEQHIQVRLEVRGELPPRMQPSAPVVILIAPPPPQQDKQLLAEALKFNAFSVLSEPVDVNVALQVMARAVTRIFSGVWPA